MTTNAQQADWLRRMQSFEHEGHHGDADGVLMEIARATGHEAIAEAYEALPKWYE